MGRPKKAGTTTVPAAPVPAPQRGALDVKGCCEYLSCSRNTLYRLIASGDLHPIYLRQRKPVFRLVDVDRYLQSLVDMGGVA